MPKDKTEKKKSRKSEVVEVVEADSQEATAKMGEDVEMTDMTSPGKKKAKKEHTDNIIIPLEDLSPIAQPLAQKRLVKKLHKAIKKASRRRQVKRGVKEVVKGIRKGDKGLLVLAADISPIDIISHLPVLSEDASIPYVFLTSKEELGYASSTKRPTSCVMICPDMKRKPKKTVEGQDAKVDTSDDYRELYDECFREVQVLNERILI